MNRDYKSIIFLIIGLASILFLIKCTTAEIFANTYNQIENKNNIQSGIYQITSGSSWTLKISITDPPFGTDKIKVSVDGPYGYHKHKWETVDSHTTIVNLKIPTGKVPVGTQYKLCIQTDTIDILLGSNCWFMDRTFSGNGELTYSFDN